MFAFNGHERVALTWFVTLLNCTFWRLADNPPSCSVGKMPEVIVISDDEQDELNIVGRPNLSSPIPPARFLGSSKSSESPVKAGLSVKIGPPGQKKRRRPSESELVKDVSNVKKAKKEERKAVSIPSRCVIHFVAAACADGTSLCIPGSNSSSL